MKGKFYDCFSEHPPELKFGEWLDEFVFAIREESSQAWVREGSKHHALRSAAELAAVEFGRLAADKVAEIVPSEEYADCYSIALRYIIQKGFSAGFADQIKNHLRIKR